MRYFIPFTVLSIVFIFGYLGLSSVSQDKGGSPDHGYLANEIVNGITDCEQQSMWQRCLENLVKALYRAHSLRDIFAAIALVQDERIIFSNCHMLGHLLGMEAYRHTQSIPEAMKHTSFVCGGGSVHGVSEGYMIEQQWTEITHEKLAEFTATACQGVRSNVTVYIGCLHGIGHGLMFLTENDLPLSLKLCNVLSESNADNICYTGVFMENNLSVYHQRAYDTTMPDHTSDYLSRPDDPLYPCSILEEQYLPRCYQSKTLLFLRLTKDFSKTMKWCLQVPGQYQSWCFFAIGEWAPRKIQDYAQVKAICDETYTVGRAPARSSCINGVVSDIVAKYGGDINEVSAFCELFEGSEERDQCNSFAGFSLDYFR